MVLLSGEPVAARRSLDSALAQDDVSVEVLAVVLDEELRSMALDRARRSSRVRILSYPHSQVPAAGFLAARQLRTAAAMVLMPGAELLPRAASTLLAARAATGSSVAVGGLKGDPILQSSAGPTDLVARPEVARTPLLASLQVDRERLLELPVLAEDPDGTVAALTLLIDGFAVAAAPTLRDVRPAPAGCSTAAARGRTSVAAIRALLHGQDRHASDQDGLAKVCAISALAHWEAR